MPSHALSDTGQPAGIDPGLDRWLTEIADRVPVLSRLFGAPVARQRELGYAHTLREICQQPITWLDTAQRATAAAPVLAEVLSGVDGFAPVRGIAVTGSGSSLYASECLSFALQDTLRLPAIAVAGGAVLTHPGAALPPVRPCLVISLARSGDSPESCGAVDLLLAHEPDCRHLAITCNAQGHLATSYTGEPRLSALTLDDRTCDRSLVMTSSFTNMIVAGWAVGLSGALSEYQARVERVAEVGREFLLRHTEALSRAAARPFRSAVYLASGASEGVARESALKMLEITDGGLVTSSESFLGLRHGPMSAVHDDTLIVAYLSSDAQVRPYELDLIEELNRKHLGAGKILVGEDIPAELVQEGDLALECPGLSAAGDLYSPVVFILAGQLLAFFRSMHIGLHPDAPSAAGVIHRVVERFPIYLRRPGEQR